MSYKLAILTLCLSACKGSFIVTSADKADGRTPCSSSTDGSSAIQPCTAPDPSATTAPNSGTTSDTQPPRVSDKFLTLAAVESIDGKVTVAWNPASDDTTSVADLTYEIYYSESPNLTTLTQIQSNGRGKAQLTGLTSYQFDGLTLNKDYYFGVIARDAAGNGQAYTMRGSFCAGTGATGDEYEICDPGSLQLMKLHLESQYVITTDISLIGSDNWNSGAGFVPIGTDSAPFTGTVQGQEKVINRLFISSTTSHTGLFGVVDGPTASLHSIILRQPHVISSALASGGLAGTVRNGVTINNCHINGGLIDGANQVGGLIGSAQENIVIGQSSASSLVRGSLGGVGGLIGQTSDSSGPTPGNSLRDSYATGNVISLSTGSAGGLVGRSDSLLLADTYAWGHVYSAADKAGGLVGSLVNGSQVLRTYARGNVFTVLGAAGGLIGSNNFATVTDSFAVGSVKSTAGTLGGLIGTSDSPINSFWFNHPFNPVDCYDSGNTSCNAKLNPTWFYDIASYGSGIGKLNWDFSSNGSWILPQSGKYPVMRWQNPNTGISFPPEFRNGRKIGVSDAASYLVWGFCEKPGAIISFTGPAAPVDTTCNGGTWEVTWNFSAQLDGDIDITVAQDGGAATTRRLVKDTADCDGVNQETTDGGIDARFSGAGPHIVCNVEQLQRIATGFSGTYLHYGKDFILKNNIDVATLSAGIGTTLTFPYTGTFNGDGFILSNFTVSSASDDKGIFENVNNGLVINLGAENVYVTGESNVAGIIGQVVSSTQTFDNLYTTGFVMSANTGTSYQTGGVIGMLSGSIANSFSTAEVVGDQFVGGLVGGIGGSISSSFSTGHISANANAGGLAGGGASTEECFATGTVSTESGKAGGLIGVIQFANSISSSYATGSIYSSGGTRVGGLIGGFDPGAAGEITNSYTVSDVFGADDVGGLIGYAGENVTISDSFIAGRVAGTGSGVGNFAGETEAAIPQFKAYLVNGSDSGACVGTDNGSSYSCTVIEAESSLYTTDQLPTSAWDFSGSIWKLPEDGGLPILNWQTED